MFQIAFLCVCAPRSPGVRNSAPMPTLCSGIPQGADCQWSRAGDGSKARVSHGKARCVFCDEDSMRTALANPQARRQVINPMRCWQNAGAPQLERCMSADIVAELCASLGVDRFCVGCGAGEARKPCQWARDGNGGPARVHDSPRCCFCDEEHMRAALVNPKARSHVINSMRSWQLAGALQFLLQSEATSSSTDMQQPTRSIRRRITSKRSLEIAAPVD